MKYFAYGSNLDEDDLVKWCTNRNLPMPKLLNPTPFRLENYRIGFTRYSEKRKGGVADIVSSPGDFCWGVVFDVKQSDIDTLNVKEGVNTEKENEGTYKQLRLSDEMITYVVVEKKDFVQPHFEYVNLIIKGAIHYGLPKTWIDHLKSFELKK